MRRLAILAVLAATAWINPGRAESIDLNSHPVIELSDLVVAVLPPDGFNSMRWDYMAGNQLISWKTNGPETTNRWSRREGLVRVHVAGVTSKVLRQKWEDLPWTVTLWATENQKSGPKRIEIKPGGSEPDELCFGPNFRGCAFTDKQAIGSPALKSRLVCRIDDPGLTRHAYLVSAPNKKPTLLVFETTGGTGGSSTSLDIRPLSDQAEVCGPAN
ncbi:MAG: hypothetical protein EXR07_02355 [Acetobacteraceae bacterium]|nr:hypothetical protein [Acetobacteraceae bacterium]